MEKITTEEVMEKLDMFQYRLGEIDQFGWWDIENIQQMHVRSLPRQSSKKNSKLV